MTQGQGRRVWRFRSSHLATRLTGQTGDHAEGEQLRQPIEANGRVHLEHPKLGVKGDNLDSSLLQGQQCQAASDVVKRGAAHSLHQPLLTGGVGGLEDATVQAREMNLRHT